MDSQAGHHHHHHQPTHPQFHPFPHYHHQQPPHGSHPMMMVQPHHQQNNSYVVPTHNNNSVAMMQQQFSQQQHNQNSGLPTQPNLDCTPGSSPPRGPATSGFSIVEPAASSAKKKRGRPRKYSPDGNIALGLSPTPVTPISSSVGPPNADSGGGDVEGTSSENPSKKARGRPPGSGKRQLDALGAAGVGFTPHVITVNVGEDIASKIMSFSQQGPRTVCILSANGAVSNVALRQPAMGGGAVTYEGRFEIISLTGSFLRSENNGSGRASGLSVSLAGADGRVLGGGVAGMLTAATPVQVIVGSFIAEGKKPKSKASSSTPPSNMLNFGALVTEASPPSQGASSDSSDENGDSAFHHEPGPYGNAGQPMHGMSMYSNMGLPKSL